MTCAVCTRLLATGEARVLLALTADQLVDIAFAVTDSETRRQAVTAIGLVDPERGEVIRMEMEHAGLLR